MHELNIRMQLKINCDACMYMRKMSIAQCYVKISNLLPMNYKFCMSMMKRIGKCAFMCDKKVMHMRARIKNSDAIEKHL